MLKPRVHNCPKKFWLQKEVSESWTVNSYIAPKEKMITMRNKLTSYTTGVPQCIYWNKLESQYKRKTPSVYKLACYCNYVARELYYFILMITHRIILRIFGRDYFSFFYFRQKFFCPIKKCIFKPFNRILKLVEKMKSETFW